jgi:hypothetical protein
MNGKESVIIKYVVRFEVDMNYDIFWDIPQCSTYVNRRFGGTYHLCLQGWKSAEEETSVQQVAGQVTLNIEVICSSETSVYIRTTRRYIPEDSNIHKIFLIPFRLSICNIMRHFSVFLINNCLTLPIGRATSVFQNKFPVTVTCHLSLSIFVIYSYFLWLTTCFGWKYHFPLGPRIHFSFTKVWSSSLNFAVL